MTDKLIKGCVARLVIRHAANMTKEERKVIAEWLRNEARWLVSTGHQYHATYTARKYGVTQ